MPLNLKLRDPYRPSLPFADFNSANSRDFTLRKVR